MPPVEQFMDKAEARGESVLVFCSNGQNRALCVVVALLMKRFCWSFYKTLEYLDYKRANLEIHKVYFSNLKAASERFERGHPVSTRWDGPMCSEERFRDEEMILVNTYKNAQVPPKVGKIASNRDRSLARKLGSIDGEDGFGGRRVTWMDQVAAKARRVIKSVGKNLPKKVATPDSGSVAPKKTRERATIKTEVEESFANEAGISSEVLRMLEIGRLKRPVDKPKTKKEVQTELSRLKEEKIGRFLATAAGTRLKIGSENDLGNPGADDLVVQKQASSANDFYKKNLKDLNKRIFCKPPEPLGNLQEKSSVSKTSTNVQDDSKQTPNDSDGGSIQANSFMITQTRLPRPMQTQMSSFKEKTDTDVFQELQRNAKTAYNRDEFYKPSDETRGVRRTEGDGSRKLVIPKGLERLAGLVFPKTNLDDPAKIEEKKLELQNKLRNFNPNRFMRLAEEGKDSAPYRSIDKNEGGPPPPQAPAHNLRAKLVPNGGNRPSSAPPKEDQTQVLLPKHLLFDGKSQQILAQKLGALGGTALLAGRLPSGASKDRQPGKGRLLKFG